MGFLPVDTDECKSKLILHLMCNICAKVSLSPRSFPLISLWPASNEFRKVIKSFAGSKVSLIFWRNLIRFLWLVARTWNSCLHQSRFVFNNNFEKGSKTSSPAELSFAWAAFHYAALLFSRISQRLQNFSQKYLHVRRRSHTPATLHTKLPLSGSFVRRIRRTVYMACNVCFALNFATWAQLFGGWLNLAGFTVLYMRSFKDVSGAENYFHITWKNTLEIYTPWVVHYNFKLRLIPFVIPCSSKIIQKCCYGTSNLIQM